MQDGDSLWYLRPDENRSTPIRAMSVDNMGPNIILMDTGDLLSPD